MNIFTEHTQQQGVTYNEHMLFAMGIALRLLSSVIAFALHAVFPFIDIKPLKIFHIRNPRWRIPHYSSLNYLAHLALCQ